MNELELQKMNERVDKFERKLDKIMGYLHNDGDTGQKGLVAVVKELSETLKLFIADTKNKDALRAQKAGFFGSVFGFVGGIAISAFKWFLDWYKGDAG